MRDTTSTATVNINIVTDRNSCFAPAWCGAARMLTVGGLLSLGPSLPVRGKGLSWPLVPRILIGRYRHEDIAGITICFHCTSRARGRELCDTVAGARHDSAQHRQGWLGHRR